MLIQLFCRADMRTVAEVAAQYRALGYRAETCCKRGVYYLKRWQDEPVRHQGPHAASPTRLQSG